MASVNVTINAQDSMTPVIAAIQQNLNALQQHATVTLGAGIRNGVANGMNYSQRLFESMLSSWGTSLIRTFTNSMKSAYKEIKAIDDELVVVRRVTGKTSAELEGMAKNAHTVAQRYGVSASEYLEGVANFTRAGYGDQAESLAELSVKLQRAGDVSQSVANAYMTAMDKAYGFNGSVESLTAAMDGANQIGNEYATTVGEIAAGIGKVASIAATAHVGADELTAALGTITAVTQRSGTEAATALRAIFLNIVGDTSTEIEEGAKWTAGEIEGMSEVLKIYAPEVVAAAEATGSLIDPMVAIGALAKSYQQGILTEAKLMQMVSDIGGKLRTNQLMVLIKNWDMYQSMLATYKGASGSIAKEVENSLDSITVKTEQLKASWTALVNDTISTGMIKGFIDGLNTAVQAVGNLGNALTIVVGLVTALKANRLATLFAGIGGGRSTEWIMGATNSIRSLGLTITAVATAISVANGIIQTHVNSLNESSAAAAETSSKAASTGAEILALYQKFITAKEGTEQYTTALSALAEALGLTAEQAQNAGEGIHSLTKEKLIALSAEAKSAVDIYNKNINDFWQIKSNFGFNDFTAEMMEIIQSFPSLDEHINDGRLIVLPENGEILELLDLYETIKDLKSELDIYGLNNGIDMTDYTGYKTLLSFLSNVETRFKGAKEAVDGYVLTREALYEWEYSKETEAAKNLPSDADVETLQTYGELLDKIIAQVSEGDYTERVKRKLLERYSEIFPKQVLQYSKEWQAYMSSQGVDAMAESTDAATDSVKRLATALNTATKAKNAFDAAMEKDAENKGFTDYQSAYAAYAEEIKAGRVNSRRAMAAAEYLMAGSSYDFNEIYKSKGYAGVNAAMKKGPWATVYGDAERTYGEEFLTLLGKIAKKNGEIVDSNGNVVATYKEVDDEVQFTVADFEGLQDVTGLSLDQIWQSMKALGVYGNVATEQISSFVTGLKELDESAGVTENKAGQVVLNYEQFRNAMMEQGISKGDWTSMKRWLYFLNELGEIEITGVPDVEGGWVEYADHASEGAEQAEKAAKAAEGALKEQKAAIGAMNDAADLAGASTPEALGLPSEKEAAGLDLSKVTEQTASLNLLLGQMRENTDDAHVSDFMQKLQESARALGGDLEIVDGQIAGITDSTGEAADWDFLAKVIEGTGEAEAILTGFGINIKNLLDTNYEIRFSVDPNDEAKRKLSLLTANAAGVAVGRTVTYTADGKIHNIDVVQFIANNTARTRTVGFWTDGQLTNVTYVEDTANNTSRTRTITYDTNGNIVRIQEVETQANGAARERTVDFNTNGQVTNITVTEGNLDESAHDRNVRFNADPTNLENSLPHIDETADTVTTYVREIKYGADGRILSLELETVEQTADGPTKTKRVIDFGANPKGVADGASDALLILEDAQTRITPFELDGDPSGVDQQATDAETIITTSATGGGYPKYNLDGTVAGVEGAVSGAEGAIGNSTAETDGTYELDGDNDGVGEAVEGAEGAIANSIDTTDGKYILGVNIDGVVSGLAAASQKIKEWQEAYNQLHEGRPEGAFPSGNQTQSTVETVDSLRAKYPKLFSKALNIPLDEEIIASNPVIRALKAILDGTLNTSVPHEGIKPYVANPMPLRELLKGLSSQETGKGLTTDGKTAGNQTQSAVETVDSLRAKYPKLFSKALGSLTKIPTDEELDLEHNPVVMAIQAMVDGTLNTSAPTEGRNLYFENPKSLNELLKGPSNKATQKGFKLPTDEEIASNPVIAAIKAMVDGKLNTSVPTGGRNPYVENPVPLWELLKGLNTPGQTNGTQVVGDVEIEATVTADEESAAAAAEDAAGTAQGTLDNETLSFEVESDDGAAATAAEKAAETAEETLQKKPAHLQTLPNSGYYDSYSEKENGDMVFTVSYETENQDVIDEIMTISAEDKKTHTITILTAGDGQQTITETVKDVNGLVQSVHTVRINADGQAEGDLEYLNELTEAVEGTKEITVDASTSAAQNRLNTLKNKLDQIKSKTVTVTTKTEGKLPGVEKNAKGTDSFRGGLSLINEEGPELVAANGSASFYGGGRPTIAAIPRGAQIFTAAETASLLSGRTSLPAYAEGTNAFQTLIDAAKGVAKAFAGAIGGAAQAVVTVPKKEEKEEEEKKEEEKTSSQSSSGGSSSKSSSDDEDKFWETIKSYLDYGLKKIKYQIDGYQDDITAIERARDALIEPIQNELDDLDYSLTLLDYEVKLLERARDDAIEPLDDEIERLKKARDLNEEEEELEEKKLAVEEARADLEDARHQRTVRYFNEESGQWEWMADQKAIEDAQESLKDAEEDYREALEDYEITLLERQKDAIEAEYQAQIDDLEDREETLERREEDLEMEKTKITHEYDESIDPLQDAMDALQEKYDDLTKFYNRLVDAVDVPTESLTEALKEMKAADEKYTAQLNSTIKLLDTLYELAPTWKAVEMGDLGQYTATKSTYGDYNLDQSTTVNIDGVTISGQDGETISEIIRRRRMYANK